MKISNFKTDLDSSENGKWFPLGENARIKLRSFSSKKVRQVNEQLQAPYAGLRNAGQELPEDVATDLLVKLFAKAVIVDWEGFLNDDDSTLEFSQENALALLSAPDMVRFRDIISKIISDDDAYSAKAKEDNLKNSQAS